MRRLSLKVAQLLGSQDNLSDPAPECTESRLKGYGAAGLQGRN